MAINIIKHGFKKLKANCPECGCEFTFLPNDMNTEGNPLILYESINCPDCGNKLTWFFGEKSGRIHVTDKYIWK